jgi:RNA polymerase sigma factor (sigma-70 family)
VLTKKDTALESWHLSRASCETTVRHWPENDKGTIGMGQGKQRTREALRTQRPSPSKIIAAIDNPPGVQTGSKPHSRHSPSRVLADTLRTDVDPAQRHRQDIPHRTIWPVKRESDAYRKQGSESAQTPADHSSLSQVFWSIWKEHHDYLRSHSLRWMSNNVDDADDALSSAMLLAYRKFPKYAHNISNTRYWLTRLVHNVCMDHHRAAHRQHGIESDLHYGAMKGLTHESQTVQQPDQKIMNEELQASLEESLQSLPASLRLPLILRCLHGLTYPDISARMNLSECAVRKRVQLARDRLKDRDEIV